MMIGPCSTRPVTLRRLREKADAGEALSMLTCYDATTARHLAAAGVDMLLVGDSAAQVILGFDRSIDAPLDLMITLTAAVKRGAPDRFVIGDMPFMSYQADDAEGVRNAGRFMTEGQADAIKLEVNRAYGELIGRLSRAGIPTIAHIGWRPQMAPYTGIRTAKVAGRTAADARAMIDEAMLMEDCGAVMLLIEQCPAEVSARIVDRVSIPVIGCGAGPACHGHVVVLQDLLGTSERHPSFIQPVTDGGRWLQDAARQWVDLLASGAYLREHPYQMAPGEAEKLANEPPL